MIVKIILIFNPCRALEEYIKYLLKRNNIDLSNKNNINCFNKNNKTDEYEISKKFNLSEIERNNLDRCYNFLNSNRHKAFHYTFLPNYNESDNIIKEINKAKKIATDCINLIKETT